MAKSGRTASALLAAAAVLLAATWFDVTVMIDVQHRAARSFDTTGLGWMMALGSLAVAGGVLLLAVLGWRSRSVLVATVYMAVGAFFAFQPAIMYQFAARTNDVPPVLPQPLVDVLNQTYSATAGPLGAVATIGAGMLIVGVAVLARSLQGHGADRASAPIATTEATPARP